MTTNDDCIEQLLAKMTLREKVGQMTQVSGVREDHLALVRQGLVGSLLNVVDPALINEYQRASVEETRLGIPLLVGRDVIHGFRTIFPIPVGQASSWNLALVEKAARIAAREASSVGVRWTFSPMVDICRDARWGRIAEGAGEDPMLSGAIGAAMIRGYQGEDLSNPESIAACAKHFVAYGATEGGRDYNTSDMSERTLRDVYLPPFKVCVDAGVSTLMCGFNDLAGVPASGNVFTLRQVLRNEWKFDGFVVSDWASVGEMIVHGFCADRREAAREAVLAGVDMDMMSACYLEHLESLVASGEVPITFVDASVRAILRLKHQLGLFKNAQVDLSRDNGELEGENLETARQLARESCVLLKNEGDLLPLKEDVASIAIIGPLADSPIDQMGCWTVDGRASDVCTPLAAIRQTVSPSTIIKYVRAIPEACSDDTMEFDAAVRAAEASDVAFLFLGESEKLSGESHCRAFLDLPGAQQALLERICETGRPVVLVLMTGRPLTIPWAVAHVPALLLAWHPGTMGGPAIADLLFGKYSPSGKLPVSIPRSVGQIPLYYNHKNTGRPPIDSVRKMPLGTPADPVGFCSSYLDAEPTPEFPFGFGLSYTAFEYSPPEVAVQGSSIQISAEITNTGNREGCEVVQLYVRDLVASVTRPVKELKGFQRVELAAGQTKTVAFTVRPDDLAFHDRECRLRAEPGDFQVWIAGNSQDGNQAGFTLTKSMITNQERNTHESSEN